MEAKVAGLMGKEGKEMEALMGRAEGPGFVMRCALEEEVAGARKTSAVSRAWRRSAGWLSDILWTRNLVEAKMRRKEEGRGLPASFAGQVQGYSAANGKFRQVQNVADRCLEIGRGCWP